MDASRGAATDARAGTLRGMAASSPIPIHLVAGFLGAGKTTAIRTQLDVRSGERAAVIVNDFGDAAFDETVLGEGDPFAITNIPGGCVCCTAPEGFVDALGAVLDEAPDRIWIEPTGLARPQDLVDTIRRSPHANRVALAPVVVLVDPRQLARDTDLELLREQAQIADVLVASRVDLANDPEREGFRRFAAELWPPPLATLECEHGKLPAETFEWPEGEGERAPRHRSAPHSHHDHASTEGFRARSFVWSPAVVFSRARLVEALDGAALERFKGVFRTQEGVSQFEVAGGTLHERVSSYRRDSRADGIVRAGDDAPLDTLAAALEAAALRQDELQLSAERIEIVLPDGRTHSVDRDRLIALPDGVDDVAPLFPKRSGAAARVEALWEALGLPERGAAVAVALDGFASEAVALEGLRQGYLLHSVEGDPLPAKQGGPFRLLIPDGTPGVPSACANVKGLAKLVIRTD